MKSIVLALLLGVLTPALGWAQEPGGLNTITGVTVNGATVEITGTKKPNFTTFTMTEPPRLVIDISEASLSGVKDVIPVGNGTITAVQTANYGSEEAAIARVLIIYAREVETDIQARGSSLVVGLSGGAGVAVAARTPPPAVGTTSPVPVERTPEVVAITSPGTTPEQATVAAREDKKRQEAEAEEARKAALTEQKRQEAEAEEARKAALAERQKRERDEAEAKAEAKKVALAEAEAQRQAQARTEAERKAQEKATRLAAEQAERQRQQQERETQLAQAAAEKQRQQEAARVAAEEKKRLALEEKQQKATEEKARREAAALAAAEARKQQQDEARAAAEEKKRLAAEERERQRAEAQAAAEPRPRPPAERPVRVAQAEVPAPAPAPAPTQGEALAVSAHRKTMTLVGFKQESSGSRVFVRTNEPVRYTVSEVNKTVVLELENTRIGDEKNARMLDTSFFDTPVSLVDATYASPARTTVRVAIKLKQQVPYQTHQEGNVLSIEFGRPTPR